jgi:hypothetical protein
MLGLGLFERVVPFSMKKGPGSTESIFGTWAPVNPFLSNFLKILKPRMSMSQKIMALNI